MKNIDFGFVAFMAFTITAIGSMIIAIIVSIALIGYYLTEIAIMGG
jgi:hypothetical protein